MRKTETLCPFRCSRIPLTFQLCFPILNRHALGWLRSRAFGDQLEVAEGWANIDRLALVSIDHKEGWHGLARGNVQHARRIEAALRVRCRIRVDIREQGWRFIFEVKEILIPRDRSLLQ